MHPPKAGRAWDWNSEASRGEQPDRGPHPQSSKHETLTLGRPNRTRWGAAFQQDGICPLSCLPATPAILFGIFLTFLSLYKSEEQGTRESCSLASRQQSSHPRAHAECQLEAQAGSASALGISAGVTSQDTRSSFSPEPHQPVINCIF